MDFHDIFIKLTTGTKFKNKRQKFSNPNEKERVKIELKNEEEEEDSDLNEDEIKKRKQKKNEVIAHTRNKYNVSIRGTNVPNIIETFTEMGAQYNFNETLINNIKAAGYDEPTPIQMQAIPIMLNSRQILACAPTGSGKTAAFLIPILAHLRRSSGLRALILCPTRELAKQTFRESVQLAEGTSLKVHLMTKVKEEKPIGKKFCKKFDILISTPNRLIYVLQQEDTVELKTRLEQLEWFVVDESDKLFEVGKRGFRDQLAEIFSTCDNPNMKTAMFSATYMAHLDKWSKKRLKGLITVMVGTRNKTTDNVEQELKYVGNENGKLLELREMVQKGISPPVLVFVQSIERAKQLFNELIYDGLNVATIHAGCTQTERDKTVKHFREGKLWILICTELMGRGIDFKGVQTVINYDFPTSVVAYIHRIGRTGRAGRTGKAITFFTDDDRTLLKGFSRSLKEAGCPVPDYMFSYKKMKREKRKKLENSNPDRQLIGTQARYLTYKRNKLKNIIEASKKRKQKLKNGSENDNEKNESSE